MRAEDLSIERGNAYLDRVIARTPERHVAATGGAADRPGPPPPMDENEPTASRYRFLDYDRARLPAELFASRPPAVPFPIEGILPQAPGIFVGAGGTGKTRLLLWEAIHIALNRPFLGHPVREGRILFVTAEDDRQIFESRLFDLAEALELTRNQQKIILDRVLVLDVTGLDARLVETDLAHNLVQTGVVPALIDRYQDRDLRLINLDPVSNLGPGELHGNDGASRFLAACWHLTKALHCAVRGVHHVAKSVAREAILDQHAGRGGSAYADNSRHVWQLSRAEMAADRPPEVEAALLRGPVLRLDVHKVSYCRNPHTPYYVLDHGAAFEHIAVGTELVDTLSRDLETVCSILGADGCTGRKHSRKSLEELPTERRRGMSRNRVREVIAHGLTVGTLAETALPKAEQVGARKTAITVVPAYRREGGEIGPEESLK